MLKRVLLVLLLLTAPVVAQLQDVDSCQADPTLCARAYYEMIRYRDWSAYALLSPQTRARLPYKTWVSQFSDKQHCAALSFRLRSRSADQALVEMVVWSQRKDGTGSESLVRLKLVRNNGLWWIQEVR